ncbi:MAG: tripartite tricarboxylate transporter TctB family protein [Neomegalonema sp.]|nr:tripartite tricarboxylate transporter TctB family protein [Neomegalonema sp.]
MRLNDAVIGAFLLLFALAEIGYTATFPKLHGQPFGPDLFPILIGIGLGCCGVVLVVRGLQARARPFSIGASWITLGDWAANPRAVGNFIIVLATLAAHIPISEIIGFPLANISLLFVVLLRLETAWRPAAGLAIAVTVFIHVLFVKLLLVPLPSDPFHIFAPIDDLYAFLRGLIVNPS